MGLNTAYLGDPDHGLEILWQANALAALAGDVEEVARTYNNLVDVMVTAGRFQEAADLGRESYGYSVAHGLRAASGANLLAYAAWALQILGRWDEAIDVA